MRLSDGHFTRILHLIVYIRLPSRKCVPRYKKSLWSQTVKGICGFARKIKGPLPGEKDFQKALKLYLDDQMYIVSIQIHLEDNECFIMRIQLSKACLALIIGAVVIVFVLCMISRYMPKPKAPEPEEVEFQTEQTSYVPMMKRSLTNQSNKEIFLNSPSLLTSDNEYTKQELFCAEAEFWRDFPSNIEILCELPKLKHVILCTYVFVLSHLRISIRGVTH